MTEIWVTSRQRIRVIWCQLMEFLTGIETKEELDSYHKYFNDYVRGGVERMYDFLILRNPEPEEPYDRKAANMVAMMERMK